ncbi:hypothetical protein Bca101_011512 [Brassica carinata]
MSILWVVLFMVSSETPMLMERYQPALKVNFTRVLSKKLLAVLTEADGSSHSSLSRRENVNQGSDAIDRDEKLDSRSDGQLARFSLLEPMKQVDSRSKKNKKYEFNSRRVSPIRSGGSHRGSLNVTKSFNPPFGSSKKFFSASVPGSRIVSRATSPISRRLSPPSSTTPTPTLSRLTTPKIVVDDTKRTDDSISQEVVMLRSQKEQPNN